MNQLIEISAIFSDFNYYVYFNVYWYQYLLVSMFGHIKNLHIYTHIYIYICMYVCNVKLYIFNIGSA